MQIANDVTIQTFIRMCKSSGTALGQRYASLAEAGQFESIVTDKFDFTSDRSVSDFSIDYGLYTFLRKYTGPLFHTDKREKAIQSFVSSERKNLETNRRLRYGTGSQTGVEGFLLKARRKIFRILGTFDYDEFFRCCDWGPGATATLKASEATLEAKMTECPLHVSPRAVRLINAQFASDLKWAKARFADVEGPVSFLAADFLAVDCSRFTTVEKDCRTDRTIDIQPTGNLFLQKGIGKMLRRRLKRVGIDLDDQSRNQELARLALKQRLATLDLANASNSVSSELVNVLLGPYGPLDEGADPTWYRLMSDTRTAYTFLEGEELYLQMFSAMGNGFTFELETLIFYALCESVQDEFDLPNRVTSVYGDDIIVNQEISSTVVDVLAYAGFEVNAEKSFFSGNFYESCGKHFYKGEDVTPVYQKEIVTDLPSGIRLANRLVRFAMRVSGVDSVLDSRLRLPISYAADYCSRSCPLKSVPVQPYWLEGDGGLILLSGEIEYQNCDVHKGHLNLLVDVGYKRLTFEDAVYAYRLRKDAVYAWGRVDLWSTRVGSVPFTGTMPVRGKSRVVLNRRVIWHTGRRTFVTWT